MTASPSHGKCDDEQEEQNVMRGKENQDLNGNVAINRNENELCAQCKRPLAISSHIIDIGQKSARWHPECFKCVICHEQMDRQQSCHFYRDQIICRDDFTRFKRDNAIFCARCRWPISPSDWVHKAASHVYHISCFNCDICLRQLDTGDQYIICPQHRSISLEQVESSEAGGRASVRILCCQHFSLNSQGKQAEPAGLEGETNEKLTIEDQWRHSSESPVARDEHRAVQKYRKCMSKKAGEEQQQQYSQLVTLDAATRSAFEQSSSPGANEKLISAALEGSSRRPDSMFLERQHRSNAALNGAITSSETAANECQRLTLNVSSASHLASSSSPSSGSTTPSMHTGDYLSPLTPTNSSQTSSGLPCKSKRVRTTFTEDQLSILQTHFQIDSNPDGQDLERIATITGLSKRVTQVWFQNSRARQKKYLIKKKPILGSAISAAAGFTMAAHVGREGFRPINSLANSTFQDYSVGEHMESARSELSRNWQAVSSGQLERLDALVREPQNCAIGSEAARDGEAPSPGIEKEPCSRVVDENSQSSD